MNLGEGDTLVAVARNAEEGQKPTRSTPTSRSRDGTTLTKEPGEFTERAGVPAHG